MLDIEDKRSFLFVPASRPERISKALAGEADAVIVDLEDAVAIDKKHEARQLLDLFLRSNEDAKILVRINCVDSPEVHEDLLLCERHAGVLGVMLPKAESGEQVEFVHAATGKPILPLIETARGVLGLADLVGARGVARLSLGALDMMADLSLGEGSLGSEELINHCRYHLVLSSRAGGLPQPIESVVPDIKDLDSVQRVAKRAAEMGFGGMLCIHPYQLGHVHRAFSPDEEKLAWAKRVLKFAEDMGGAAFQLDGKMVDAPVIARAKMILARARP